MIMLPSYITQCIMSSSACSELMTNYIVIMSPSYITQCIMSSSACSELMGSYIVDYVSLRERVGE